VRNRKFKDFLFKPADTSFLLRLTIYAIVTEVSAFIARFSSNILLNAGLALELNPLYSIFKSTHSTLQGSITLICLATLAIFLLLFLWAQYNPNARGRAEALALAVMLSAFIDMVHDVLILLLHLNRYPA